MCIQGALIEVNSIYMCILSVIDLIQTWSDLLNEHKQKATADDAGGCASSLTIVLHAAA